jgi:hypothetical protein
MQPCSCAQLLLCEVDEIQWLQLRSMLHAFIYVNVPVDADAAAAAAASCLHQELLRHLLACSLWCTRFSLLWSVSWPTCNGDSANLGLSSTLRVPGWDGPNQQQAQCCHSRSPP